MDSVIAPLCLFFPLNCNSNKKKNYYCYYNSNHILNISTKYKLRLSVPSTAGIFNLKKFTAVSFSYDYRYRRGISGCLRRAVMDSSNSAASPDMQKPKIVTGPGGYVLEDVPHLSDYIPDLPVSLFFFINSSSSYV